MRPRRRPSRETGASTTTCTGSPTTPATTRVAWLPPGCPSRSSSAAPASRDSTGCSPTRTSTASSPNASGCEPARATGEAGASRGIADPRHPRVLQLRQAVRIGLPPPDDLVHRRPAPEGLAHLTDERLALGLEQELEEAQRLGVVRHVPDAVPGKLLGVGGGVGGDLAVELVDGDLAPRELLVELDGQLDQRALLDRVLHREQRGQRDAFLQVIAHPLEPVPARRLLLVVTGDRLVEPGVGLMQPARMHVLEEIDVRDLVRQVAEALAIERLPF